MPPLFLCPPPDSFIAAFHHPAEAVQFAVRCQLDLLHACKWPEELAQVESTAEVWGMPTT